jgi:hypothetical protein
MKLKLDYGTTGLMAELPDRATVIEPVYIPPVPDPMATLQAAIRSPIGKPPLRDLVKSGLRLSFPKSPEFVCPTSPFSLPPERIGATVLKKSNA